MQENEISYATSRSVWVVLVACLVTLMICLDGSDLKFSSYDWVNADVVLCSNGVLLYRPQGEGEKAGSVIAHLSIRKDYSAFVEADFKENCATTMNPLIQDLLDEVRLFRQMQQDMHRGVEVDPELPLGHERG